VGAFAQYNRRLTWLRTFAWDQTLNTCLDMDGFSLATIDACWLRCRKTKLTQKTAAVRVPVNRIPTMHHMVAS